MGNSPSTEPDFNTYNFTGLIHQQHLISLDVNPPTKSSRTSQLWHLKFLGASFFLDVFAGVSIRCTFRSDLGYFDWRHFGIKNGFHPDFGAEELRWNLSEHTFRKELELLKPRLANLRFTELQSCLRETREVEKISLQNFLLPWKLSSHWGASFSMGSFILNGKLFSHS